MNYYQLNQFAFERQTEAAEVTTLDGSTPLILDLDGRSELSYAIAVLYEDYRWTFSSIAKHFNISESRAINEYYQIVTR